MRQLRTLDPSEHQIQCAWFAWWNHTFDPALAWAIPNGGLRHIGVAQKLKAEGVRSGVPDVFIAMPVRNYHGLFLEFKTPKGVLSVTQKLYAQKLVEQGYQVKTVRSVDEAIQTTLEYLNFFDIE